MVDLYSIFDALGVVVFVHDAETGEILFINDSCNEVLGYSPEELMKVGLSFLATNEKEYSLTKALARLHKAAKGEPQTFEWKATRAGGEEFWVEVSLNGLHIGEDNRVVATIKDITQRRKNREKLEQSEKFQKTINSIMQAIFPLSMEDDILWGLAESCGLALGLEDLVIYICSEDVGLLQRAAYGDKATPNKNIVNPILLSIDTGIVGAAARNKKSEIVNNLSKDKRYIQDVISSNSEMVVPILFGKELIGVIDSEHSQIGFFTPYHLEIVEAVASLVAVKIMQARSYEREQENQLSMDGILNANPDLIFILSDEWRYLEVFTKNQHMLAAPKEKLLGSLIDEYLEENELERVKMMLKNLTEKGVEESIEFRRNSIDGVQRWFSTKVSRVDYKGQKAILLMSRDITDKKVIQQQVQESEKLMASINKNISDGIYRSLPNDRLVYVNDAFVNLFGFDSKNDIAKVKPHTLYAFPEDREKVIQDLSSHNNFKNTPFQFRRKDGSIFWGAMSSMLTKDAEGNDVIDGAVRDITEQRANQIRVEESQKILSSINRNISDGIYRSYSKGGLIYVNDAFATMFGYRNAEEILKVDSLDLYVDRQDRGKEVTPAVLKTGHRSNLEILFKRKDGSTFWGLNNFLLTKDHDDNDIFDGAIRDISKEKEAAKVLNNLNVELTKRNENLALKEQELGSSNEELRSNRDSLVRTLDKLSERNFELDQLVYKTSHDLRSPLRSVLGLTNLMKIESNEFDLSYINKIDERILKMDDFIKSMLDYSKASRKGVENEEINIEVLIANCIADLEYLEGFDQLKINIEFEGNVKTVITDSLRNLIIFANIISNAFKYRNVGNTNSFLNINVCITQEKFQTVFEDNGIGISKKYIDQVFDMFFRATEKSDGSGLGMYIVKQSIEKLNGTIDIESKLGKGTKITIEMPVGG